MDKKELKNILKPLLKECVMEILVEHGINSFINQNKPISNTVKQTVTNNKPVPKQKSPIDEQKKIMLESIGKSGYINNNFDPFSGTKPLTESQASDGMPSGLAVEDPGIDISNLMNNTTKWKALMGGKGK